jgi:hypothetical protein
MMAVIKNSRDNADFYRESSKLQIIGPFPKTLL